MPTQFALGNALTGGTRQTPATMICSERERLLQAYHNAVAAYADVVSQLKNAERRDFPRQFAMADAAREKCDKLRDSLAQHRASHGC